MRFALLWSFLSVWLGYVRRTEQVGCALYEDVDEMVCFDRSLITPSLALSNTSWIVEFYSSWCGHCQHFAPTWKEVVRDTAAWSSVIRVGAIDCAATDNLQKCTDYGIKGFPTIKFFNPGEVNPERSEKQLLGSQTFASVKAAMLQHVVTFDAPPPHWPSFQLLDDFVHNGASRVVVLVFEMDNSSLGKELILDHSAEKTLHIYRVSQQKFSLVKQYSILEFPSLVILFTNGRYQVFSGHSVENPRSHFKSAIADVLNRTALVATMAMPAHLSLTAMAKPVGGRRLTPSGHINDILGAISYALRREVALHSIVSGTAYSALLRFITLLECAFLVDLPGVSLPLGAVREGLEARLTAGFIIRRDWMRILDTKLDLGTFPLDPVWESCNGSKPHLRGFPCGLWMLMHSLTVLSLPVARAHSEAPPPGICHLGSKEALRICCGFIANFFSCEHCRTHFAQMARAVSTNPLQHDGDAILWLWETHNGVNRRLEGGSSTDPAFPKVQFPTKEVCPYCYTSVGTAASAEVWNRTSVMLFLWNFYTFNHSGVATSAVLRAAWAGKPDLNIRFYTSPSASLHGHYDDVFVAGTMYGLCFTLMLMATYWLFQRRARRMLKRWTLPK